MEAGRYAEQVGFLKRVSSIGQATLIQETLARYLDQGGIDRHLRSLHSRFSALVVRHIEAVSTYFPPGTSIIEPSGGFLPWAELPIGYDTYALHERTLDIGLGLATGLMFSASKGYTHAVRIEWSDAVENAYRSYGTMLANHLNRSSLA